MPGDLTCVRCKLTRAGAGRVGLPGDLGSRIEASVCAECWKEWMQQQVRVINHYGLKPMVKEDREKIYALTREFFGIPPAA